MSHKNLASRGTGTRTKAIIVSLVLLGGGAILGACGSPAAKQAQGQF